MNWVDLVFVALCGAYLATIAGVLYALRSEPLYEPRVLFTLAASLWLLIIPGYVVEFEGYLAAKPGLYETDVRLLSVFALGLMLLGYGALVGGATLAVRIRTSPQRQPFRARTVLVAVCLAFVALALANFLANVYLVSGGNVFSYMANFALRPYEVADDLGVSAAGYLLGFIAVQLLAYMAGRGKPTALVLFGLLLLVLLTTAMRTSQGRLFQVLVFLGACYVAYAMGAAQRNKADIAWPKRIFYLLALAGMGVGLYFLRLASALKHLGVSVDLGTATVFFNQIVHFALERGNVPNFPVVFTIIEKIPSEQGFLLGKSLFNWALFLIPKSILKGGLPHLAVDQGYVVRGDRRRRPAPHGDRRVVRELRDRRRHRRHVPRRVPARKDLQARPVVGQPVPGRAVGKSGVRVHRDLPENGSRADTGILDRDRVRDVAAGRLAAGRRRQIACVAGRWRDSSRERSRFHWLPCTTRSAACCRSSNWPGYPCTAASPIPRPSAVAHRSTDRKPGFIRRPWR